MWCNHSADIIRNKLNFKLSLLDLDLWYKPMMTVYGIYYDAYILVYEDNILIIDKNSEQFMSLFKDTCL